MIHREAFISKTLPTNLHLVMKQVIEVKFHKSLSPPEPTFYATLPRNGFKIQMLAVSHRGPLAFKRKGTETCMLAFKRKGTETCMPTKG